MSDLGDVDHTRRAHVDHQGAEVLLLEERLLGEVKAHVEAGFIVDLLVLDGLPDVLLRLNDRVLVRSGKGSRDQGEQGGCCESE